MRLESSILASRDLREVYSFGHLEYDRDTLAKEYFRDLDAGLNPHIPENYLKMMISILVHVCCGVLQQLSFLVTG